MRGALNEFYEAIISTIRTNSFDIDLLLDPYFQWLPPNGSIAIFGEQDVKLKDQVEDLECRYPSLLYYSEESGKQKHPCHGAGVMKRIHHKFCHKPRVLKRKRPHLLADIPPDHDHANLDDEPPAKRLPPPPSLLSDDEDD